MSSAYAKTMRRSILGLGALVVLLAGCAGAGEPSPTDSHINLEGTGNNPRVETLVLAPDVFDDVIEITGDVDSIDDALLSAEAAGTVEMLAKLGQQVDLGTVVARLDQVLAQAALELAEAAVDNAAASLALAEDSYSRMEPLHRDSIISAQEFQEVQTRLQQARASMRQAIAQRSQAQKQLDNTLIRAPFAGTVEEHRAVVGERVGPGSPVIRIIDARRVKIAIGIPERYAGDIKVGASVELDFPALGDLKRTGRVTFAANSINPSNRTFSIEAEVNNEDGRLKPEMIADVLISRQRIEDVLIIPRASVVRDEDGNSVYVVNRNTDPPTANRKMVTLGAMYAERVIAEDGLSAGDEIIVLGHKTITESAAVEVATQYHRLDQEGIPVANQATTLPINL